MPLTAFNQLTATFVLNKNKNALVPCFKSFCFFAMLLSIFHLGSGGNTEFHRLHLYLPNSKYKTGASMIATSFPSHASFPQLKNGVVAANHCNIWNLLVLVYLYYCTQVMCGRKQRNNNDFQGFFSHITNMCFLCCQFTTLAKYSRHTWRHFGSNIR